MPAMSRPEPMPVEDMSVFPVAAGVVDEVLEVVDGVVEEIAELMRGLGRESD
jgi:hypothetical protein